MTHSGFVPHDHQACIADALAAAEERCAAENLRLTPVRRRVLEILLDSHRAQGAYDILARLTEDGFASQPPVAYRALDFLQRIGVVHRIERRNAYVACASPGRDHLPTFLVCRGCAAVAEGAGGSAAETLNATAAAAGFTVETAVVEAEGLCPACRRAGA
jgi:Fur family zinc uptake transcriptional regulator